MVFVVFVLEEMVEILAKVYIYVIANDGYGDNVDYCDDNADQRL